MTTIRIEPSTITAADVLEYARALIDEHGWRQGDRPSTASDSTEEGWQQTADAGLSLHDAIGMSCFRLSGETGTALGRTSRSSKDFDGGGRTGGSLRTEATGYVETAIKKRGKLSRAQSDIEFNDKAKDVKAITDVLDIAIKEASTSAS